MANENKNINELVTDDEEPTAELDAVTFRQDHDPGKAAPESDDNTFDFADEDQRESKTISKLRYDIEQLRSRWQGLETELKVREEITGRLNGELAEVRQSLARKEKLIKSRDGKIRALKSEIRDREEQHRQVTLDLQHQLDAVRETVHDVPELPAQSAGSSADSATNADDAERLARTEAYADLLRRKLQDVLAQHEYLEKERSRLTSAVTRTEGRARELEHQVETVTGERDKLDARLSDIRSVHEEEMRTLRFELGEAQETVAQTEELNTQLASDLIDTRGFKVELERMLCDSDEASRKRITELETELEQKSQLATDLEEKLDARSNAINVLLSELARKAQQMESLDDIGSAISDLDVRIAEQFDEAEDAPIMSPRSTDRVTRVLLGKIGDKVLRFPLFKDRLTIGRTADNDIQLNAPYISRKHAVVTTDGEMTRVIDWGSRNGVYVNSRRVTEHFLKNGDIVTIGNAHFRYDERPKRDG